MWWGKRKAKVKLRKLVVQDENKRFRSKGGVDEDRKPNKTRDVKAATHHLPWVANARSVPEQRMGKLLKLSPF